MPTKQARLNIEIYHKGRSDERASLLGEITEWAQKLTTDGGGSGRRFKIALLSFLSSLKEKHE